MIKNSIVKNFKELPLPGTLNMQGKANFLCGKGMDIQDSCRVSQISIVDGMDKYSDIKKIHTLSAVQDSSQTITDANNLTKWKFIIDGSALLKDYLYDQIYTSNPFSVFKSIPNEQTSSGKSSIACLEYIQDNILSRYKVSDVILWSQYYDLKLGQTPGTNPIQLLRGVTTYDQSARPALNSDSQKQTVSLKQYSDGTFEMDYKQTKSSQDFAFVWYYDVIYARI